MRHYEIVVIIHPDQSKQVDVMAEKYKKMITDSDGKVHRFEDWGRKHLSYPIQKIYKAHYLLFNIECNKQTLDDLNYNFRFNDAILRNLIISTKKAITDKSVMLKQQEKTKESNGKTN